MMGNGTPQADAKVPPGPTAPATVAPVMDAKKLQGMIQATLAINALERSLALLGGTTSEEGQKVMKAVLDLRKVFGGAEPDLQKAELKSMAQSIPPVTQPTPGQGAPWAPAV